MLTLYRPKLSQLRFRQTLLADPETMSYNRAWGGTIAFPQERWADWYARWVAGPDGGHFYRYLRDGETFVGEAAYHLDGERGIYLCDVIVLSEFRGRRFGSAGLELLCAAARERGVETLWDEIALEKNPAVDLFLRHGFREADRTPQAILVKRDLLPRERGDGAV